jgi:hypothetical protein
MPNTGTDGFRTRQQVRAVFLWGSEEFRNSGRQFAHVGNDEHRTAGFQACPVLRPAMASCAKADCGHPGGKGGVDTCRAVLEG